MVTTIKITCDGVFIQTNSYRIRATARTTSAGNLTSSPAATISPTTASHFNIATDRNNNLNNRNRMQRQMNFCGDAAFYISTKSTTVSSSIAPMSLPTILTTSLLSPSLSSTSPSSRNKILIGSNAPTSFDGKQTKSNKLVDGAVTSTTSLPYIVQQTKTENGTAASVRCISADDEKRFVQKKRNGIAVRRRNTFKNYLIECKENLIRRLSSSALNGQYSIRAQISNGV